MITIDLTLSGTNGTSAAVSPTSQLSSLTAQSFTSLLSEAFSEALSKFGINPNSVQLTIDDQSSQTPVVSQNSAASQTAGSQTGNVSSVPAASQTAAAAAASIIPAASVATAPTSATAATVAAASSAASSTTNTDSGTSADDAYWAAQPAAVQQLRGIQSMDERQALGEQLANEGYSIDVPIMIWGRDAGKVTAARESYGYTWVPSALQQPLAAAPGITGGGITPYDPTNPPSGSIQV
jgi:hypothetical protein